MMDLYINHWQSVSALGSSHAEIHAAYLDKTTLLKPDAQGMLGSRLSNTLEAELNALKSSDRRYSKLDRSVLLGLLCAQKLKEKTELNHPMVNVGSSRGATEIWEKHYQHFIDAETCKVDASPSTTLGNISSWIGQLIGGEGAHFSHSITCSSAHHAVLNAVAWLNSGMSEQAVVGGCEAPLTHFGMAQMQALGIYAQDIQAEYPVKAFALDKKEGAMALGEAACLFSISHKQTPESIKIAGIGWGTESILHGSSISSDGLAMQKAMKMATKNGGIVPDVIVSHSPGTYKGDKAESEAIKAIFGEDIPVTNNKWKIGHSFGASAAMSMEMAVLMLQNQVFYPLPYITNAPEPKQIKNVLINSVGFGGNAVSILLGI
jgi:3-oxoacyl-(acyl-carrier-protein) synthase